MSTAQNIVVKKSDGTTDVTYKVLTGSAGDGFPAVWQSDSSATLRSNRWTLEMVAQDNGPKTARRVTFKGKFPIARMVNGVEIATDKVPFELTTALPKHLSDEEVEEVVYQFINAAGTAQVMDSFVRAYSPT